MEVTEIRVFPVDEDKLKAYVTITLDHCFVVRDLKVIRGPTGFFVSMPSKKRKDGTFRDIAHPLNSDTRRRMEDQILARYRSEVSDGKEIESRVLSEGSIPKEAPPPAGPGS